MFLEGLDKIDQKIVSLLIKNARMSYSDIAKEVAISRVAVKNRIEALEKKGIIEGYTTIIDPQMISGAISCFFSIEVKPDMLEDVIKILDQNDTVTQIYRVTGRSKLHVHVVASDNNEMENFINMTIDKLPGLINVDTDIILSRIKDIKGIRL